MSMTIAGGVRSSENVVPERLPHQVIQPRARDPFVRRRLHLLFERACQIDVQLQDIRVGHPTRVAAVDGHLAVCSRGLDRGCRGTSSRASDQHAAERLGDRRREVLVDESFAGGRHLPPDRRGSNIRPVGAIEQRLLDRDRRAEVVGDGGVIERVEREAGGGELPLRKQRTEHEHRLVAALPRLRDVDFWEVAAANLCDAFGRFPFRRRCRSDVGVAGLGARDRLRQ